MNKYEGYIHVSGTLMVKKIPDFSDSITDNKYVGKHLGIVTLPSLNQANRYFKEKTGGKTHSIDYN